MITPLVKFVNRNGFPCVESNSVTSNDGVSTVAFDNHRLIQSGFSGGFWVRIVQSVETGTDTIQFTINGVSNSTLPLYLSNGTQATAANITTTGGGVFLCFYDRNANRLQLIG